MTDYVIPVALFLTSLITSTASNVVEYTAEHTYAPIVVEASVEPELPVPETIEQKIDRIALEHLIPHQTLYNLVECESQFDPKADNGYDRGLVQISRKHHPTITDEQAFDPDFSLNWAAKEIAENGTNAWVCGNCYLFARTQIPKLPSTKDLIPNSIHPSVGGLVILNYNGVIHYGVVTTVTETGINARNANLKPGSITKEFWTWEYLKSHDAKYWRPAK